MKPDRQPDRKACYRRSVTVNFLGTDHASGVHVCSAPILYSGPDVPKTSVSGVCQDKASNTSGPAAIELRYDATPPVLNRVRAEISRTGIALKWIASKDAESFTILRRPGLKGKGTSTVYNGRKRAFVDGRLRQGVKYRYSVTAFDQAGNGAVKGLVAQALATVSRSTGPLRPTRPASTLLGPAAGARLKAPPVLAWSAVRKATYYNVQLFRNGRKIFTAWPSDPTFRVPSSWKFGGSGFRLTPGVYRGTSGRDSGRVRPTATGSSSERGASRWFAASSGWSPRGPPPRAACAPTRSASRTSPSSA